MNSVIIVFMVIASIFAVATIGYVVFDLIYEMNRKKK